MSNIDSHATDLLTYPPLDASSEVEAASQRVVQQRTAGLIVAANVIGLVLLVLTST
jgi:hypothetical protein